MKTIQIVSVLCLSLLFAIPAGAQNLPANHCEIFIQKIEAAPSSHGSGGIRTVVKVGWIGNDESIRRVGFYGYGNSRDLGNNPNCHFGSGGESPFHITDGRTGYGSSGGLGYGEYEFEFAVHSGSCDNECPGYNYSSIGAFFVETNKNTYWVNPNMDSSQYFYFDDNGFQSLSSKGGTYSFLNTDREDLRYYNPLGCK